MAINAVFNSWDNDRAIFYRKHNNIPKEIEGTAVNVQSMVYGNKGDTSGTGVCFSRDPSTGKKTFYGEYLMNAQGEDVVAGVRTPLPIRSLRDQNPRIYKELVEIKNRLETHYRDVQDMEFTIEESKLYILQTRNGKRTAVAGIKFANDFVREGLLTKKEAVMLIEVETLDHVLHKRVDPTVKKKATLLATGLNASPGGTVGKIVF